jgi:hypothetical protein
MPHANILRHTNAKGQRTLETGQVDGLPVGIRGIRDRRECHSQRQRAVDKVTIAHAVYRHMRHSRRNLSTAWQRVPWQRVSWQRVPWQRVRAFGVSRSFWR